MYQEYTYHNVFLVTKHRLHVVFNQTTCRKSTVCEVIQQVLINVIHLVPYGVSSCYRVFALVFIEESFFSHKML